MRLLGKKNNKQQPLSDERRKEFFEYGQKISKKLGIPEKIQKTNAFYAKHPRSVSFTIFGFCCCLLIISQICLKSSAIPSHKSVGEKPSDYTASTLFEAMEMHSNSIDVIKTIAEQHDKIKLIVDSLQKLENPTAEDSAKIIKGLNLLKQIEGDDDNGY